MLGQRGIKPETRRYCFLQLSHFSLFNAASSATRRGQQSGISGHFDLKEASHEQGT